MPELISTDSDLCKSRRIKSCPWRLRIFLNNFVSCPSAKLSELHAWCVLSSFLPFIETDETGEISKLSVCPSFFYLFEFWWCILIKFLFWSYGMICYRPTWSSYLDSLLKVGLSFCKSFSYYYCSFSLPIREIHSSKRERPSRRACGRGFYCAARIREAGTPI